MAHGAVSRILPHLRYLLTFFYLGAVLVTRLVTGNRRLNNVRVIIFHRSALKMRSALALDYGKTLKRRTKSPIPTAMKKENTYRTIWEEPDNIYSLQTWYRWKHGKYVVHGIQAESIVILNHLIPVRGRCALRHSQLVTSRKPFTFCRPVEGKMTSFRLHSSTPRSLISTCLMRIDEALNSQFNDVVGDEHCPAQFGGECIWFHKYHTLFLTRTCFRHQAFRPISPSERRGKHLPVASLGRPLHTYGELHFPGIWKTTNALPMTLPLYA